MRRLGHGSSPHTFSQAGYAATYAGYEVNTVSKGGAFPHCHAIGHGGSQRNAAPGHELRGQRGKADSAKAG